MEHIASSSRVGLKKNSFGLALGHQDLGNNHTCNTAAYFICFQSGIVSMGRATGIIPFGQGSYGALGQDGRRLDDSILFFWLVEASVLSAIAC